MNAKLIIMLRKMAGISQHEFANRIGYSRSMIARIETNRIPVSRKLERKIIEEFGTRKLDKVRRAIRIFEGDNDK